MSCISTAKQMKFDWNATEFYLMAIVSLMADNSALQLLIMETFNFKAIFKPASVQYLHCDLSSLKMKAHFTCFKRVL